MRFTYILNHLKTQKDASIGYASGVFDVFHNGHSAYIERCQASCDILVIGVDCDHRVANLKGPDRPYQNQSERLASVASVNSFAFTKFTGSDRYIKFIVPKYIFCPDSDEAKFALLTKKHLDKKIIMINTTSGISSTSIIRKIRGNDNCT